MSQGTGATFAFDPLCRHTHAKSMAATAIQIESINIDTKAFPGQR
jgi:hypothetical protein